VRKRGILQMNSATCWCLCVTTRSLLQRGAPSWAGHSNAFSCLSCPMNLFLPEMLAPPFSSLFIGDRAGTACRHESGILHGPLPRPGQEHLTGACVCVCVGVTFGGGAGSGLCVWSCCIVLCCTLHRPEKVPVEAVRQEPLPLHPRVVFSKDRTNATDRQVCSPYN